MAKAPASDAIQTPDKMKPLLALSKHEPVQAAIALTGDGEGIILLDKKAKPKKVRAMLRAAAAKAKITLNNASLRFGRAEVDTDYDSGMVRFFVNKDAPGNMRVKLVEVVKRIPYQKVEINVDPSLEGEPEDEGEDTEAPEDATAPTAATVSPPPPPPPPASGPDMAALAHALGVLLKRIGEVTDAARRGTLAALAGEANAAIKAKDAALAGAKIKELAGALGGGGTAEAPPPPPVDLSVLAHDLAALVKQIPAAAGSDAGRRAALAKLAGDANTALKAGDGSAAQVAVGALRQALGEGGGGRGGADLRGIWNDAKESVDAGLNRLADSLRAYEDPDLERIADLGLFGIGTGQTVALNKALIEFAGAGPATREAAAKRLRDAVAAYRALLADEPMVGLIDCNPEVPMTMARTLGGALDEIEKALA